MNEHFRAFSFVDRITSHHVGASIAGSYAIPSGIATFPHVLVAEAVGQLAAWSAMAAVDFRYRPVAGLNEEFVMLAPVRPGQTLALAATLDSVDDDAVSYGGTALADGVPVMRLRNCVGPMMPIEEFDDPAALRERFAVISGGGATPGGFAGLPPLALDPSGHMPGESIAGTLHVPEAAPFFADHFPRKPVFPGTLLMGLNLQLAYSLLADLAPAAASGWQLRSVSDTKFRSFTVPGSTLECTAKLESASGTMAVLIVESRDTRKRMVASAKALFGAEESR